MTWDGRRRSAERQAGTVLAASLPIAAAGTVYSYAVTFDQPFAATPAITVSASTSRPDWTYCGYSGASTTGFTIYYGRTSASGSTTAFAVSWQAMATTQ